MKQATQTQNLPSELFKTWFHSREEDAEDLKVYRAEGFDFPPARYREKLTIKPNGEATIFAVARNDAHQDIPGTWQAVRENLISFRFPITDPNIETNLTTFALVIVSVDEEILKVRPFLE